VRVRGSRVTVQKKGLEMCWPGAAAVYWEGLVDFCISSTHLLRAFNSKKK
jgi:hypothetical protein